MQHRSFSAHPLIAFFFGRRFSSLISFFRGLLLGGFVALLPRLPPSASYPPLLPLSLSLSSLFFTQLPSHPPPLPCHAAVTFQTLATHLPDLPPVYHRPRGAFQTLPDFLFLPAIPPGLLTRKSSETPTTKESPFLPPSISPLVLPSLTPSRRASVMSPASEEHPQRSLGVSSTARRPGPSPVISSASTSRRSSFYKSVKGVFSRADSGYGSSKSTTTTSSSLAFPPLPTSSPSPAAGAAQLRTLFAALSAAPPSPHGNGLTASESAAPSDPTPKDSLFHSVWAQIKAGTFGEGVEVALDALTGVLKGKGELDDREMFLEELIGFLGKLPEVRHSLFFPVRRGYSASLADDVDDPQDSPIRQPITDKLLQLLWADLPHGNYAHVGDKNWRSADGSNGSEVPVDGKGVGAAGSRTFFSSSSHLFSLFRPAHRTHDTDLTPPSRTLATHLSAPHSLRPYRPSLPP